MAVYTYDDGSTIDTATGAATEAPMGNIMTDPVSTWGGSAVTPGTYVPGGSSWADVLKFGIGHWAAYKQATIQPTAQPTVYVNSAQPAPASVANMQSLLKWGLLGAAVFFGVKALSKG